MTHGSGGDAGSDSARVAPVIPLFGAARADGTAEEASPSERHPAHGHALRAAEAQEEARRPALRAVEPVEERVTEHLSDSAEPDPAERRETAERVLLRKLRAKALSISEARLVLRGEGLDSEQSEEIVDDCLRRGYLDDRILAELLVRSGVERRNQGRVALARTLAQRRIERSVIDGALAELPDDDAERALEYARSKARSLARLDPDTALRRLLGQLARRGFSGSAAMGAAKQALKEASGGPVSGVRFRDSE